MQKLPSQLFKADSLCVHITSRAGPSRLHAEELGLIRRMQVFSFFNDTMQLFERYNFSKSFLSHLGTQERSCHLHPRCLGLRSFYSDLLTCLEIIATGLGHLCEDPNLETIDTWETLHHPESGLFEAVGKDTIICFPWFWDTKPLIVLSNC